MRSTQCSIRSTRGRIFSHNASISERSTDSRFASAELMSARARAGSRVDLAQRIQRGVVMRLRGVFDEHLRIPENVVHRGAEVMPQLG